MKIYTYTKIGEATELGSSKKFFNPTVAKHSRYSSSISCSELNFIFLYFAFHVIMRFSFLICTHLYTDDSCCYTRCMLTTRSNLGYRGPRSQGSNQQFKGNRTGALCPVIYSCPRPMIKKPWCRHAAGGLEKWLGEGRW